MVQNAPMRYAPESRLMPARGGGRSDAREEI
jgi:hypothetical protein